MTNTNYISQLSDGTNTYVIKDAEARTSLTNMQTTTNLVTSLSASSTDSQYPSAKCIYDMIGNIESILHNINLGNVS